MTAPPVDATPKPRVKLRPYQADDVQTIRVSLRETPRGRVLYVLPTGGGKTEVGIEIASGQLAELPGSRVAWLTHRQELRRQSLARIEGAGLSAIDLTQTPVKSRRLLLGGVSLVSPSMRSVESLVASATPDDLLIVDEAHHSVANTWDRRVIAPWPGYVLGVTATPWRMSRREGFQHLYDELVCGATVRELIDQGYLCDFTISSPSQTIVQGEGRDLSGDYSIAETEEANEAVYYSDLPVRMWEARASHSRRTIWYTTSVAAARILTDNLKAHGYPAGLVLANTPAEERERTMARFASGVLTHLVNVAIATEGVDIPDADCVVILRPTRSLVLYRQMGGRALRPGTGKHALILDATRSYLDEQVGHPADDYPWSLAPRGAGVPGLPPVRFCSDCEVANAAAARACGGCGAPFGKDCAGCGRFRFQGHWDDMEEDEVCHSCRIGQLVDHIIFADEVPQGWKANESNTVLWHDTFRCHVMRSRSSHQEWLVGYRPLPNSRRMAWVAGYPSYAAAFAAAEAYVAGGFEGEPEPPGPAQVERPVWRWNRDRTSYWHQTRRCVLKPADGGGVGVVLGYEPRDGGMKWLMGYSDLEAAAFAAEGYIEEGTLIRPSPESAEHQGSREWRLSVAGYAVMPSRFGSGWIYGYPVQDDPGERNMVYVTNFTDAGAAMDAAIEHLLRDRIDE